MASVARRIPGATCLPQALAVRFLLSRQGYASQLVLGTRREQPGRIAAHAWIYCQDIAVIGGTTDGYSLFPPIG